MYTYRPVRSNIGWFREEGGLCTSCKPPRHCRPIKVPAMEKKLQYKAFETVEKQSLEGYKEWLPDNNGGERRRDLSGEPCLPCTVVAQWCATALVQWGKQVLGGWMGGGNPEYKVYTQPAREREGKKHTQTHNARLLRRGSERCQQPTTHLDPWTSIVPLPPHNGSQDERSRGFLLLLPLPPHRR